MAQYIDKSALVAEIERRVEEIANASNENNRELAAIQGAQQYELINLIQFINTLEVKEVDLEKEVRNFLNDNYTSVEEPDEFLTTTMQIDDMTKFAEHFYALGLKTQKGE